MTSQGLRLIAVFHSSPKSIRQHVAQQDVPFPIVADPEKVLYNRYGGESSIKAVARAALTRLPDATMAMASGFLPGSIDGDQALVPADFVIDEGGIVRIAYYGRDIGDHLPIARIESFLSAVLEARKADIDTALEQWAQTLPSPAARLKRFVAMMTAEGEDLSRYGCPLGSLLTELGKT